MKIWLSDSPVSGCLCFGVLAVFSVYWPGLHGGFFFDDHPNIVLNPGVKLAHLSWESLRLAWSSGISGQFGRPVSQLSFALNYYFSGFSPFAFKLTNLVIHCLNGVLVYLLGYQLLDSLRQRLKSEQRQSLGRTGSLCLDASPDPADFSALCRAAHDQPVGVFSADCADSSHHCAAAHGSGLGGNFPG